MDKIKTILLFGAPGSGKGTQGKMLGTLPGFRHLACGDVFRSIDLNSEIGKVFLQYSSKGELVPDDFTVRLWREHIDKLIHTGGFRPRAPCWCWTASRATSIRRGCSINTSKS